MPHLPRDIGEQIAVTHSRRRRLLNVLRRLMGLPPRQDPPRSPPSN